jgi:hypothetical protein
MESVNSHKAWKSKSPISLILLYEQILQLIEATWLIKQLDYAGRLGILSPHLNKERLNDLDLYCKPAFQPNAWDYFPRALNRKQYRNPYKTFTKFFKYSTLAEWKEKLHDALHYSLESWEEEGSVDLMEDILIIKKHLDKVVEACHLIAVREDEWLKAESIRVDRKTTDE